MKLFLITSANVSLFWSHFLLQFSFKLEVGINVAHFLRYWKRAGQLSEMLASFRDFHSERQDFWIEWSARNGKKLRTRRLLRMDYIGDTENTFWLSLLFMILILLTILR